jgi:translation elongation factor EF-Tu-like GTPase
MSMLVCLDGSIESGSYLIMPLGTIGHVDHGKVKLIPMIT